MKMNLKELIEFADSQAVKIFRHTGQLLPMWHAFKSNGEQLVLPQPSDDKDKAAKLIAALFELENVETYCFMSEAWILHTTMERDPVLPSSLEHHPDRREAIMFSAENREGDSQTARRFILRPEHGKAKLAPLQMDDMANVTSEGRMVGLLSRRK